MTAALPAPQAPGVAAPVRRSAAALAKQVLREQRPAAAGAVVVTLFVLVALLAPWLAPYDPHAAVGPVFAPPSGRHWLGLDDGGADVVSLLIEGARVSLLVGFAATAVGMVLGGGIGIVTGYFGGVVDMVLMRITDYFIVVPSVPLMIVLAALLGPSLVNIILVIGFLVWTTTARIVRAQVASLRERVYVRRAHALGAGHLRILVHHIVPHVGPLLIANTVLTVAVAIFEETALSFLGLGDPARVSWGTIIEHAFERNAVSAGAWWAIVPAGVCVSLVIMGCHLVGQALEDALNPRLRAAHLSARPFRLRRAAGPSAPEAP